MAQLGWGAIGVGAVLAGRPYAITGRPVGAALICLGALCLAAPAMADQNIPVADNGTVACVASAKDLTRISLAGDQFAAVSKISTGNPAEDFKIVNEPVRGDIYLSVPDGFARSNLSFFGTTRKGYVYKFVCQVRGNDAEQVFVTNTAIKAEAARDWEVRSSPEDSAVRLAQAMYRSETIEGFEVRQDVLEPVTVGKLEVQQVGEYRGADLKGLVLRVRNTGRDALPLDENMLAARGAVAFMTPVSELAPGQSPVMGQPVSLREWREGLYETRRNFLGIAARTSQRFDQTFALIQRTQMLEKTLRTQLSPQMSAALRFSRTLNQQVQ